MPYDLLTLHLKDRDTERTRTLDVESNQGRLAGPADMGTGPARNQGAFNHLC